jgi:hypothetical protein
MFPTTGYVLFYINSDNFLKINYQRSTNLLPPTVLHPRHPIKHNLARTVVHQVSGKVAVPLKLKAFACGHVG